MNSCGRFGVPVCPHAGGVGLCEYVIHLRYVLIFLSICDGSPLAFPNSLIDYIAVSGTMERNVLEFVDHLHEHFVTPCSINTRGRYNVPTNPHEGYRCALYKCPFPVSNSLMLKLELSIEMHKASIAEFEWPTGSYWVEAKGKKAQ